MLGKTGRRKSGRQLRTKYFTRWEEVQTREKSHMLSGETALERGHLKLHTGQITVLPQNKT